MKNLLKAQDDARGDARLVLRFGVEVRQEVIDLDRPNRDERQYLQIDPAAQRGGERALRGAAGDQRACAYADGFMGATDKKMRER